MPGVLMLAVLPSWVDMAVMAKYEPHVCLAKMIGLLLLLPLSLNLLQNIGCASKCCDLYRG